MASAGEERLELGDGASNSHGHGYDPDAKDITTGFLTDKRKNSVDSYGCEIEPHHSRETWARKTEYILSMVGFCVGLANIWRFPYVCIRNGGGVFLIPFFLCLVLCAMPLFFLEVCLGQYMSRGPLQVWSAICPLFKGIGVAMNLLCLLVAWYYTIILAWAIIYLVHSFKSPLPWTLCGQPWNSLNCMTPGEYRNNSLLDTSTASSDSWSAMNTNNSDNSSVLSSMGIFGLNSSLVISGNDTNTTIELNKPVPSTEEFWLNNVLEISSGLYDVGGLPWHTGVALLAATLIIYLGIMKGIHSSGKVVYVTATLPYVLLTVLIINGATLPGAKDGVIFYIKPDFSKLLLIQTWIEATIQVFYSLGPAYGALITMASYNKFNNNCLRDSIFLSFVCEGTSVYGGLAIFTVVGHMAHTSGVPIANFTRSGSGLAFVVYPEAISYLPVPQLWGVLFFLMLVTLGLDSQFTIMETILTSFIDAYPHLLKKHRTFFTSIFMVIIFIVSIPFATRGGIYLFQLVDWYLAAFTLLMVAVLECIIVSWVYGADRILKDVQFMLGSKPPYFFIIMWRFVTPGLLLVVLGSTLATYQPPKYGAYHYDEWGILIGWVIAFSTFVPIVICMVIQLIRAKGSFVERIKITCQASDKWAPMDPKFKAARKMEDS